MHTVKTDHYKYLGLNLSSVLSWSHHKYAQRSGSWLVYYIQKLLKILYRSPTLLKLNKVLIRPNLEYAGVVWDPYLVKDIVVIENVQKFALATGLLQAVEL